MKNELIIARYTGQRRGNARQRLLAILQEFGLEELTPRFLPDMPVAAQGEQEAV